MHVMSFEERVRPDAGSGERVFLDFVVSGQSLFDIVEKKYDLVAIFGDVYFSDYQKLLRKQLLRKAPTHLGDNRVPIYICPECGDEECGFVSVKVTIRDDLIGWSDIGYQYEDHTLRSVSRQKIDRLQDLGPYEFDKKQYETVLGSLDLP